MLRPNSKLLRKKFVREQLEERAMLAVLAGDAGTAFEPNDTLDSATDLGLIGGGLFVQGQVVQVEARIGDFSDGAATNTTDVDIYRVDLRTGDRVTFDIDAQRLDDGDELFDPEAGGAESNSDLVLSLFRRDQDTFSLVTSNAAAVAPGDATEDNTVDPAIVDFVVPATDTYFIAVSGADAGNNFNPFTATGRNSTARTGQYIFTVSAADDDSERPDVDVTVPILSDGEANIVSWEIADESGISSSTARIWKDDVIIRPNDAVPLSGSFDLGEFGAGDFRITITATDDDMDWPGDQLTNIHSVLFTIADDDTAGPDIQLTPSSQFDGANNMVSWEVTDDSGFALIRAEITRDGQTLFRGDTDAVGSFDLNAEGIGDYSITVTATDADDDSAGDSLSNTETISFTIIDDDTEPPQIDISQPGRLDGTDNTVSWTVSDESGFESLRATISRGDEVLLDEEVDPISEFDLNVFEPGTYTITLDVTDGDDDWIGDSLSSTETIVFEVTDDDTTPPLVTVRPSEEIDSQENSVAWAATDASGVTVDVQVTKNGVSIFSSDEPQDFLDLNSEGPGDFVITVTAVDEDNDWPGDVLETVVSESFTIVDDDTDSPVIDLPLMSDVDGANNRVTWSVSDASGLESLTATITQGETVLLDGPVDLAGEFDLNEFGLGTFQVEINATDADADWVGDELSSSASGELIVTDDDDAAPSIVVTVEDDTDGDLNEASWVVEDPSGLDSVSIQVTRDNVQIFDRVVPATNSINLDEFGPGDYTITVRAEDADQDWDGDQRTSIQNEAFIITDDDTAAPEIVITPSDSSDGENNNVSWSVTDASGLTSVTATISRNGETVLSDTVDAVSSFDINELGIGDYSISLEATDADSDWANDSLSNNVSADFVVVDDDTQVPDIEITNGSEDGADNIVAWNVTDDSGLTSVAVTIAKDGEVVFDEATDAAGSLDLNQFGIGNYSITVAAVDADQDWVGDELSNTVTEEFLVGDDDVDPPSIVFNDPNLDDSANNFVMWTVTDPSGVASVTARITRGDLVLLDGEVEPTGSFDLNEVGSSDYSITVTATDADDDRVEDQTSITETLDFTITDDDTVVPQFEFVAPDASDGTDNRASWIVSDDSGVQQVVAILSKDDSLIFQREVVPQSSLDMNEFGVGTFTLRFDADDADGDWVGDAEGATEEFTFTISDDDTDPPEIEITSPSELDSETNVVSWTVSDASGVSAVSVDISRAGQSVFSTSELGQNSFNLDSLGPGDYSITVEATDNDADRDGDELSTSVTESFTIADEDTEPPTITVTLLSDVDGGDNMLMFDVSDTSGLKSVSAKVSQGDTVLLDGPIPGLDQFDLNSFGLGTFVVEVAAEDADDDWEGDSLVATQTQEFTIIDDDPDSPRITVTPADETDGGNVTASWEATDASGFSQTTVQVTLDNVPIIEGPVSAIDSVDLTEFGPGEYTVTVRGDDADNDWEGDSRTSIEDIAFTIVDDDTEPPMITIAEGATRDDENNVISWQVTDPSGVSSVTAEILREGVVITSGPVDADGSLDINQLGIGTYRVTVTATDADEDRTGDQLTATATTEFTVTDDDETAPTITLGNVSSAVDGDDNVVTWEISDDSGISEVLATITKDGNELRSGPINEGQTSFDLNEFGIGTYTVSIEADDADADWIGDRSTRIETAVFEITDDDISGPTISISPPTGSTQGAALESTFSWTATDDAGLSSGFVRLERRLDDTSFELIEEQAIELTDSQTTATGEKSLDGLGLGTYRLTVGATDADSDRVEDESSTIVSSILSVVDPTPPKVVTSSGETSNEFDRLGTVRFVFDEDVSASLDSSDFELRNTSTDEVFAITEEFVWDPDALSASIDLSGRELLSKGLYAVVVKSSGVSDAAGNELDGDGDGSSGGDHVAGTFPITWKGDATRNADVEFEDFLIVSDNFGESVEGWSDGDFDGNGTVDFQDFLWVTWNWDQVPTPIDPAETLPTQADFTQFDACSSSVRATAEGRDEALEISIRNPAMLEPNTPTTLDVGQDVIGFFYDEPTDAFWCNDALDPDAVEPRAVTSQSGSVTVTITEPFPTNPIESPIGVRVVVNDMLFQTENGELTFDDYTIEANGFGFLPG